MKKELILPDDGFIPNSEFPLVIYRRAVRTQAVWKGNPQTFRRAEKNNWVCRWGWKVYRTIHYHSNVHELLVVIVGQATLRFGGPRRGRKVRVRAGDAIVIPAGVAHQAVRCTKDFHVFGFYRKNAPYYDMCRGLKRERQSAIRKIKKLGKPPKF